MATRIQRLLNVDAATFGVAHEIVRADAFSYGLADETNFIRNIAVERKRTERSAKPFLLMLIEGGELLCPVNGAGQLLHNLVSVLKNSTRETDSLGWYQKDRIIGVLFTEVGDADSQTMSAILAKVGNGLRKQFSGEQMALLKISIHRYPDEEQQPPQRLSHMLLFPDLANRDAKRKAGNLLKRVIDVIVSMLLLVALSPLLLVIVLAIKLTSAGPVFFRQYRVGQYGIPFTFLKFRSMRVNSDPAIHKEYVSRLISGEKELKPQGESAPGGVFKITADPRVTAVGQFLRRSSLDELPQLWNVFKGEMSLVGPRPPIPYEFECYDIWHRRRALEAKPGITGLWQVTGRSRTSFDDMVRLDLNYVRNWSLWLDLKILLQTPRAVLSGDGAY